MHAETTRLTLRDLEPDDFHDLLALSSDPEVRRTNDYLPGEDALLRTWLEETVSSAANQPRAAHQCAMILKATGAMIGWIGLEVSNGGRIDFGYALRPTFWNRGYTTEAVRAMLEYSFNVLGARLVTAFHLEDNPASGRVMLKAGMRPYEEAMREANEGEVHYVATDEEWHVK